MGAIRFVERPVAVIGGGGGGNLTHGVSFTVTGTGLGTKSTPAPLVWDNCSSADGTSPTATYWDGFWPTAAPTSSSNMKYRPGGVLGINPPHANSAGYLTGAHEDSGNSTTGQGVAFWKDFTKSEGMYLYFSWYNYVYEGFVFTGGMLPEDGNWKIFGYSKQGSIYELPNNWYISQWPSPPGLHSTSSTDYETVINDDASLMDSGQIFQGHMINPLGGAWVKQEVEIRIAADSAGYVHMWENNFNNVSYDGALTDGYTGTTRSAGLGGFARACNSANNRRYFSDIYMDLDYRRLVLANNATYASATIIEPQPATAWSTTSITATCNKGKLSAGTVYPFVQTSPGTWTALTPVTMN